MYEEKRGHGDGDAFILYIIKTRWINRARKITCNNIVSWPVRVVMAEKKKNIVDYVIHVCGRGRKRPSDYKNRRPPKRLVFFSQPSLSPCAIQIPPFSSLSLSVIRLIGCRNGPLRSFRFSGPCPLGTGCYHACTHPDRSRCWCPNIPSNSTGFGTLPIHGLSAHVSQIIRKLSLLMLTTVSPNKFTPIQLFAEHNPVTIGAIQLPRTRIHCAKPYSLITFLVPFP